VKRSALATSQLLVSLAALLARPSVALCAGGASASADGGPAAARPAKAEETPPLPDALRLPVQAVIGRLAGVAWTDWQVTADNPGRKQRLAWLAKDFAAPAFKRADRLDEAVLLPKTGSGPPHVGLMVVHFAKCRQLAGARKRVLKTGRHNFALPVLTVFRMRAQGHRLIFVLSETPLRPEVDGLFKDLDQILGPESACSD
jgi:hypothetical protein